MMTIMKLRMMSIRVGCGILILTSGYQIQTTEVDGITSNTKKKSIFPSSDCLIYRLKSRFDIEEEIPQVGCAIVRCF